MQRYCFFLNCASFSKEKCNFYAFCCVYCAEWVSCARDFHERVPSSASLSHLRSFPEIVSWVIGFVHFPRIVSAAFWGCLPLVMFPVWLISGPFRPLSRHLMPVSMSLPPDAIGHKKQRHPCHRVFFLRLFQVDCIHRF